MSRVIAVVEGLTEQTFVREILAPWIGGKGVFLSARLVGKPGHKGGVGSFDRASNDIVSLLKQEPDTYVTTMFDFYGMPESWPGREDANKQKHMKKAHKVQSAIHERICATVGGSLRKDRLIPYVQMHEFEALLYSKPSALSHVMREPGTEEELQRISDAFDTPEDINDDPNTAPSKRIEKLYMTYRKPLHGMLAAMQITVEVMRSECPHFREWCRKLESLDLDSGGSKQ